MKLRNDRRFVAEKGPKYAAKQKKDNEKRLGDIEKQ
tara:strand:- start:22324 stop:22431 length:108 start_codon:yes stop_codon:yes gene_type:complete